MLSKDYPLEDLSKSMLHISTSRTKSSLLNSNASSNNNLSEEVIEAETSIFPLHHHEHNS
jgi:hypothetical protein